MGHLVKCGPAGVRGVGVTTGKMRVSQCRQNSAGKNLENRYSLLYQNG